MLVQKLEEELERVLDERWVAVLEAKWGTQLVEELAEELGLGLVHLLARVKVREWVGV
jgi:hypothetical protein